ncbi:MAG TPA: glycosyltransferase family 2 protein [Anaerolineae bacterium]|nr:glycosyltransferase family 2 protein [Anaerolineae bacterium]HQH38033.1 glycosyltransferase family 2 protein [Anaerolineae bacterium]
MSESKNERIKESANQRISESAEVAHSPIHSFADSPILPLADALISVIIPNWNGASHLPVCLDSLQRQTYPYVEVIVADNGSQDDSCKILKRYPDVRLLELGENRGFTGACNAGFHAARGEIQVLLNNDTEVDAHWLTEIADAFARHSTVGLVASKMLLFDRRDTFHTAGDYVTPDGFAHNRGVWEKDEGQYDHAAYVFSACGGSAAYRRTMLTEIGLLDEDFFFSFEDVDLAWRAQLAGWRCLYAPRAVVYHKLKASGGGVTASFYDGRNRIYTLAKNYPADLWRRYWRAVLHAQLKLAGEALRMGRGAAARATLRGIAAGVMGLPKRWGQRCAIQATRRVDAAYLEQLMTPPYEIPL